MRALLKQAVQKAAASILAGCMTMSLLFGAAPMEVRAESYGRNGIVRNISSPQLVEDMGLGYNIGNTFDSLGSFIEAATPLEYQKGWGNEPITEHFIDQLQAAGFKTIRLPVSWAQWMDAENNVNPAYLDAVQEVVDWCMARDMYVILNVHHDGGFSDTSWIRNAGQDYEGVTAKYRKLWSQIAGRFASYGDHLILESMNEVAFEELPLTRQYEILNAMNQIFVDTVRATGGNNATRHLMIAGYNTDIAKTCDRRYQMPQDPAGHLILSIHYYSPSPFCVATRDVDWCTPLTSWGTEADIQQVRNDLDKLAKRYLSQGTPVIIGEYGVLTEDDKEPESIRAYLKEVPKVILEYGMCPVLWDTSNAGDMKFVERVTGEFYDPVIKANYQELAAQLNAGQINRHNYTVPSYRQVQVEASPDGWVSIASYEPSQILGIRFGITCASSWDSYGGGGLYLDGWTDMPAWQFSSVYDEIEYIFTDAERARLKDRIGVQIQWTDESQGGNHREELSITNNVITLLYADGSNVGAGTQIAAGGSGGSGGSGGGSGSSGGSGSAGRPNYSTEPGGAGDYSPDDIHEYTYILKADRNSAAEGDDTTGVYRLSLSEICPDYRVGDTVKVTATSFSDGGYSYALQAIEGGSWNTSDSWGSAVNSWECTPDDGNVALYLWYMGGSYFMFNLTAEVTHAAPIVEEVQVGEGESLRYSLTDILSESGISNGSPISLTVGVRGAEEGMDYAGTISFTDANGIVVSKSFSSDSTSVTLYGVPEGSAFTITAETGDVVITSVKVQSFDNQGSQGQKFMAQADPGTTVTIPESLLEAAEQAPEGQEPGVKIYVENTGGLSGVVVFNGDWNTHVDIQESIIRTDAEGTYIWCAVEDAAEITQVAITSYWSDQTLGIRKIVRLAARAAEETPFEEVTIAAGESLSYSLADVLSENGISAGSPISLTVKMQAATEGEAYSGTVSFTDENGILVSKAFSSDSPSVTLYGVPEGAEITITADAESQDAALGDAVLTSVKVQAVDNQGSQGQELIVQFDPGTTVTISDDLMGEVQQVSEGQEPGVKVYVENSDGLQGVVVFNGDWNSRVEFDQNMLQTDADGTYIWCAYANAAQVTQVAVTSWWSDHTMGISGIVRLAGAEEEPIEEPAEDCLEEITETQVVVDLSTYLADAETESGQESGIKLYVETDGYWYNGAVLFDAGWGETQDISINDVKEDEGGTYLWLACDAPLNQEYLGIVLWSKDYNVRITGITLVEGEGTGTGEEPVEDPSEEPEEDFLVEITELYVTTDLSAYLADAEKESGQESGIKLYVETDGNGYEGAVLFTADWAERQNISINDTKENEGGTYLWLPCDAPLNQEYLGISLWEIDQSVRITGITLVEGEGTGTGEEPADDWSVEITETGVNIDLSEYLADADMDSGKEAGIKLYIESEAGYNGIILFDSSWNDTKHFNSDEVLEDENGTYLWLPCEDAAEKDYLVIVLYYMGAENVQITGITIVEAEDTETEIMTLTAPLLLNQMPVAEIIPEEIPENTLENVPEEALPENEDDGLAEDAANGETDKTDENLEEEQPENSSDQEEAEDTDKDASSESDAEDTTDAEDTEKETEEEKLHAVSDDTNSDSEDTEAVSKEEGPKESSDEETEKATDEGTEKATDKETEKVTNDETEEASDGQTTDTIEGNQDEEAPAKKEESEEPEEDSEAEQEAGANPSSPASLSDETQLDAADKESADQGSADKESADKETSDKEIADEELTEGAADEAPADNSAQTEAQGGK